MSGIDIEKLLFLIESRPAIYNFKLKEHSDKRVLDELWLEIAEEMQWTVTDCKAKYTTLRNSYARFFRQNVSNEASKKRRKVWYLSGRMEFLKDYMMVHRRNEGSSVEQETNEDDSMMSSIPSIKAEFEEWGEALIDNNMSIPSDSEMTKPTAGPEKVADADVEKLLFLIENRPPIYNYKLQEHSLKRVTEKLWQEIAEEMGTSVTECKTKYTTLRVSYARFLRESNSAPTGYVARKKKVWYLSGVMSFLKEFMMSHHIIRKLDESNTEPNKNEDDNLSTSSMPSATPEFEDWVEPTTEYNTHSGSKKRKQFAAERKTEPLSEFEDWGERSIDYNYNPSGSKKRKLTTVVERIAEPVVEYLKAKLDGNESEDANLTFFKSVLPDLRKLSNSRQRKVKQEFLFNLNKLLDEQEME